MDPVPGSKEARDAVPVLEALEMAGSGGYLEASDEVDRVQARDGVWQETVELAARAVGRVRTGPGSEF